MESKCQLDNTVDIKTQNKETDSKIEPTKSKAGYVYLLQEREFVRLNKPTYKIGRTTQTLANRFGDYPKNSHIILALTVLDCFSMEDKLKEILLYSDSFSKPLNMYLSVDKLNTNNNTLLENTFFDSNSDTLTLLKLYLINNK